MFDIVGLGELLIDFTPAGKSAQSNDLFECNPGGGVPNLVVAATMLGAKGAFIGKVGNDLFGRFLRETLNRKNVDTTGLILTDEYMTTLAFVHLFENGERDFTFYRKTGADTMLRADEISLEVIDQSKALHFSSLTFTTKISADATLAAIIYAKEKGKLITYDPNWRPMLWENQQACKQGMLSGLSYADIVKVSEEELEILTNKFDENEGANELLQNGSKLVLVTKGEKGSKYYCRNGNQYIPPFNVKAIDTTGAGDAFFGAVISGILANEININDIDLERLNNIIQFASATAALSVTRRGGIPAMPNRTEVELFINAYVNEEGN